MYKLLERFADNVVNKLSSSINMFMQRLNNVNLNEYLVLVRH